MAGLAHDRGLKYWMKPTGRSTVGRGEEGLLSYRDIIKIVDGMNVQTQGSCVKGPGKFRDAVRGLVTDYQETGSMDKGLFVQISLGGSGPNAVTPREAFECAKVGWSFDLVDAMTMWWASGKPDDARAWLRMRENCSDCGGGNGPLVRDSGFEKQSSTTISPPWRGEGTSPKGIDQNTGRAHSGQNNAWIRTNKAGWNAISQTISVAPNTTYRLEGWIRSTGNVTNGYFGARAGDSTRPHAETRFGPIRRYTRTTVELNSGNNTTMTVFAGYWAPAGTDSWIQLDDITITPV